MNEAKVIAQNEAPMDTGNLRYNSIRAYSTPNGFRIISMFTVAFYGNLLDVYGARGTGQHKGWWSDGVATAVGGYIDTILNGKRSNFHVPNEEISKFSQDNPARRKRFYNSMVADNARKAYLSRIGRGA